MESDNNKDESLAPYLIPALGEEHQAVTDSIVPALLDSIAAIAETLRASHHVAQAGSANAFGDDQLNVDVLAEKHIRDALATCAAVATVSSEEDPVERAIHAVDQEKYGQGYTVAFDPLDGSSIIAPNWTVGTIVGIWNGSTAVGRQPLAHQIASIVGVYGPRTTAFVAVRMPGRKDNAALLELGINGPGDFEVIRPQIRLLDPPYKTRYFAPANLRAASEDPAYMGLVTNFIANRYTLRYSGGLVPDVVHALVKGHGVYISPVTKGSKAKLRRLYELFPVALILECAGGTALDPADGTQILLRTLQDINETGGFICGNTSEVVRAVEVLAASTR